MNLQLKGRIAVVTGGSKGIGAAIVRQLAREGVHVAFCARASQAMSALEEEITKEGGVCAAIPADVFDPQSPTSVVEAAVARWGGVDILINNVGGAIKFGGFEELSDEDWMRAYEFNVLSVVRFTRAALPYLRKSSLRRIVNISSISALQPGSYNPHYSATKSAIVNLSKHLANIFAKEGILVNTVCPGPIYSESWQNNIQRAAEQKKISFSEAEAAIEKEESAKIPLGSVGDGEQVASVVALLASPASSWTTGSCVHINGGKLATAF